MQAFCKNILKNFSIKNEHEKNGENTFIDVLTSQTEKTTARQQLIRSVIEYNKAQAQILFDTGIISPKTLLQEQE